MLVEFVVFLLELIVGLVYPLLMTLKISINSSPDYAEQFQTWVFYWISFILLQHISSCLDYFLWNLVKVVILVLLAIPQFRVGIRASNYLLGPFKTLVVQQFRKIEQLKEKLG